MNENWRPCVGFEGYYEVSDLGNVRSVPRLYAKGDNLALIAHHKGYLCVNLSKEGKRFRKQVATLVAQAFIPNPSNRTFVNHIDGESHNNHLENLEWTTVSDNTKHAYGIGRIPRYTCDQVRGHIGPHTRITANGYFDMWVGRARHRKVAQV